MASLSLLQVRALTSRPEKREASAARALSSLIMRGS